jgi:oligopeptide transport system substrate-binding protein
LALAACGPAVQTAVVEETDVVAGTVVAVEKAVTAPAQVASPGHATREPPTPTEPEPAETLAPAPTQTITATSSGAELEGLWYPVSMEPPTLDPQAAEFVLSALIIKQLIEGLFEYRGDGSIEPTGATGFDVSGDGRVYTIRLRKEAAWSDGVPVVAQHYVDGIMRLLDPDGVGSNAYMIFDIEGAKAFNSGENRDPASVGVRAVDDHTLEIRLAGPAAHFETLLAFSTFFPVRLDLIEEHGDRWTEPGNYLSNGPYLLETWDHGEKLVLVKNPTYWNADQVAIDTVTMPIVPNADDMLAMYEDGELHTLGETDMPLNFLPNDLARILGDPVLSRETQVLPRPGVFWINPNCLRPPLDQVLVRKALASAIDRKKLVEEELGMPWRKPLSCTTPPLIGGYQESGTCGHTFDPDLARQYLAEAGYPGGEGLPPLKVWAFVASYHQDAAKAVAAMWQEHLGLETELQVWDGDQYNEYLDNCWESREAMAACKMDAYLMGWVMDYGDAQNQLEVVFEEDADICSTCTQYERYAELLALARTEPDAVQRAEYYKEADRILSEEQVAIIPLKTFDRLTLVKEGVTFEYPPFGQTAFKHWALP